MNETVEEGATVVPPTEGEQKGECMGRYPQHRWRWVWLCGQWTDRCRCSTCGEEKRVQG